MNAPTGKNEVSFWPITLLSLAGPLVWALHLGLAYLVQHVVCKTTANEDLVFWFVIAISLVALAALLPCALIPQRLVHRFGSGLSATATLPFLATVLRLLALLSMAAIIWAALGVFVLSPCGSVG